MDGALHESYGKIYKAIKRDRSDNVSSHFWHNNCHCLKTRNSSKKVIIKLSKRKDADKICQVKKISKLLNLELMGTCSPVLVNDCAYYTTICLCAYYKKLWVKCKKLWDNKFINGFWVLYGLIKGKVSEISPPVVITHDVDFKNKVAGNPLLKDNSEDWDDSNKW